MRGAAHRDLDPLAGRQAETMPTWASTVAPAGRPGLTRAVNVSSRRRSAPDGGCSRDLAPKVTAVSAAALSWVTW